jgi:hypothetical protein
VSVDTFWSCVSCTPVKNDTGSFSFFWCVDAIEVDCWAVLFSFAPYWLTPWGESGVILDVRVKSSP